MREKTSAVGPTRLFKSYCLCLSYRICLAGAVAQGLERRSYKAVVVGSIPASPIRKINNESFRGVHGIIPVSNWSSVLHPTEQLHVRGFSLSFPLHHEWEFIPSPPNKLQTDGVHSIIPTPSWSSYIHPVCLLYQA